MPGYPHTPVTAIRFITDDGVTLEGELREPDGSPRGTAVLCHPHPRHGGSKDHPLLWALRNELAGRRGLTVLAFNFRGVMASEGRSTGGEDEDRDVAAAVARVREEADGPTVLVGWSFGAWMALRYATRAADPSALALLGIPLGRGGSHLPTLDELGALRIPVLLVVGDGDPICPVGELRGLAEWIPEAETRLVEGADHFFGRREREVAGGVGEWVERAVFGGG
jgi:uncharacterized protein